MKKHLALAAAGITAFTPMVGAEEKESEPKVKGRTHFSVPMEHSGGNVLVDVGGRVRNVVVQVEKYPDGSVVGTVSDTINPNNPNEPIQGYEIMDSDGDGDCEKGEPARSIIERTVTELEGKKVHITLKEEKGLEGGSLAVPQYFREAYKAFLTSSELSAGENITAEDELALGGVQVSPNENAEGTCMMTVDGVKKRVRVALNSFQGNPAVTLSGGSSRGTRSYDWRNRITQNTDQFLSWEFVDKDKDGELELGEPVWTVLTKNHTDYSYNGVNLTRVFPTQTIHRIPADKKNAPREAAQKAYDELREAAGNTVEGK